MVDAQFLDQMGSPYLLAHGMGEPVADALPREVYHDHLQDLIEQMQEGAGSSIPEVRR